MSLYNQKSKYVKLYLFVQTNHHILTKNNFEAYCEIGGSQYKENKCLK